MQLLPKNAINKKCTRFRFVKPNGIGSNQVRGLYFYNEYNNSSKKLFLLIIYNIFENMEIAVKLSKYVNYVSVMVIYFILNYLQFLLRFIKEKNKITQKRMCVYYIK